MFVDDLDHVAKEIFAILETKGSLIISVPHPAYWMAYYLENKYKITNRPEFKVLEEGYFTEEPITRGIGGDNSLIFDFKHRTLSTYINTFTRNGFFVSEIDEPKFNEKYINLICDRIKNKMDIPMRLNIRFVKQ